MSFMDEYNALKKKRLPGIGPSSVSTVGSPDKQTDKSLTISDFMDEYNKLKEQMLPSKNGNSSAGDIAPVSNPTYFKAGAFSDGYQAWDVTKTILGTTGDAGLDLVKGAGNLAEGIAKSIGYTIADAADLIGNLSGDEYSEYFDFADEVRGELQRNIISDEWLGGASNYVDRHSVLGDKSDAFVEGIGYTASLMEAGKALGAAGLSTKAVSAITNLLMGTSAYGSGMNEAYQGGADDTQARTYGLISAGGEVISEMMFGGLGKSLNVIGFGKGLSSADDMLAKKVSGLFKRQIAKNISEFSIKAGAEGIEEVVSGSISAIAKKMTYMSKEDILNILKDENLLEQFIGGVVTSGFMQSGIMPGTKQGSLIESVKEGKDFVTGYTQNEQNVVNKYAEELIAEREKGGKKLSGKEKSKIYDQAASMMEKGYISTDTIEKVLGGEEYSAYEKLQAEYAEFKKLYETEGDKLSEKQKDRLKELKKKNDANSYESALQAAKEKLSQNVYGLVKNERLSESYNERARMKQRFTADLNRYSEKQRAVVQNAIDSGILNNTNKTHDFVDLMAKLSADQGVPFDFTNNQKLKESGFGIEGKTVDGYVTKDGITLNINSHKALNYVVGHEITHVLEGTELYAQLQSALTEYAKAKKDYKSRRAKIEELYRNVKDADIDAELTADMVGDYLFSDPEFVRNLSVNHRNVFLRIYDEIKYLLKQATAGSDEARKLEKAEKIFDDMYRKGGKNTLKDGEVKYSFAGENAKTANRSLLEQAKQRIQNGEDSETVRKETGWFQGYDGKWRFEIDDSQAQFRPEGDVQLMKDESYRRLQDLTDKWADDSLTEAEAEEMDWLSEQFSDKVWEEKYRLDDYLDHPDLYDAYPMLRYTSLVFDDLPTGEKGFFNPRSNTIVLSRDLFGKHKNTLLHEIQHIIQKYEGFAKGSSPKYWNDRMESGYSKRDENGIELMPSELYKATAGEIEARDTASRADMTSEQRKNTRPDIDRTDAVFVNDGVSYDFDERLAEQLNDWKDGLGKKYGSYNGQYFRLGTTPDILVKHGAPNAEIIMYEDCILKVTGGKHSIALDEIAKLPSQLNDPILLFHGSVPNSFVALTELLDKHGNDVIVAVHINKYKGRTVVNKIASIYSKSDDFGNNKINKYVKDQIDGGNLIDASAKKAPNWFTTRGLQLPKVVQTILDANSTVPQKEQSVNTSLYESFENDTVPVKKLNERVSGDALLDAEDLIDEIKSVGGQVDDNGYVTLYHRTTKQAKEKILSSGKMTGKEDGIFFSTKENGQAVGYGDSVIEMRIPAEKLVLDDIFDDEAHLRYPLANRNAVLDVSEYITPETRQYSLSNQTGTDDIAPLPGNVYGKDIALETAPVRENGAVTEEAPVRETVQEKPVSESLAGMKTQDTGTGAVTDGDIGPVRTDETVYREEPIPARDGMNAAKQQGGTSTSAVSQNTDGAYTPAEIELWPTAGYQAEEIGPVRQDAQQTAEAAPVRQDAPQQGEAVPVGTKQAKPESKQRKWVETSTESEPVNRQILPDNLDQSVIHYQPISNEKTLGNANAMMDRMGYDTAVSYFNSQFANRKVSLDDIALGERLIQEAVKRKDFATAGELIQNVAVLGTELGQKVQALSIIQRLTPEGQLKMLQKIVERGKAKGDKAFEGVEITPEMEEQILDVYDEDGNYDTDKLNEAVENVKQQIADQMGVSRLEKVDAWRYLSMLGNPKTHIRNIVSNFFMKATVSVKNAIARTVESIAPIKSRTKTWKRASEDVKSFARKTAEDMKDVISGDSKVSESASIKEKREIFKNKILNKLYDFNSDWLSKEDWWFSKSAFQNSLQEFLTANGIETEADIKNNPEIVQKGISYATEQSQIATFRQYSWLANKINDIQRKNTATDIVVGAILPFKKTPINIAKAGLNYSPLGFAKTLTYDLSQVKKGNMEASTLIDHLAQNTTGTALTLIGYMLASMGILNGSGDDDKEAKYDYQLGKQSYSVNIGGSTFSLSWLSPAAMPLFVGANAYEQLTQEQEWNGDVVVQTLAETLDPLSEMSFLSSLDSVLSSYDSGVQKFAGIGEAMIQSYASQFIPTVSSQLAATLDDTKRSTKVAGDSGFEMFDKTINQLKYKIPFLRETLEPSTDIWGNEVKQSENVITRAVENFIAPYSRKDSIATGIDEEIKNLYAETGDNGIIPAIPYNYVNYKGGKYEMSASEYTAYKKTYGQTASALMEDLFATDTYKRATSEERTQMVNRVYDYARDEAKREYLEKEGVKYTNATKDKVEYYKENSIKGAIENDMTVEEYEFYVDYPGKYAVSKAVGGYEAYKTYSGDLYDIKSDKDKNGDSISGSRKKKVLEYINQLDADYGEKIILYKSEYPGDDRYNAEIVDYLNSRDDISYDEMVTILTELGFRVLEDGTIRW